jgi:hypothetical protein
MLARNVSLSYDGDGDRGKPEKALTPLSLVVQKVLMPYSKDAGHHQTSIPISFFSFLCFFFPFHNSESIDKKHQACKKYRKVNHGGPIGI